VFIKKKISNKAIDKTSQENLNPSSFSCKDLLLSGG